MINQHKNQDLANPMIQNDCSLQVRIATHSWEKHEIYRLRYEVYVEEMAKSLGSAANESKQLVDSLDARSILLYVQAGDEMAATVRLTIATTEEYPSDLATVFKLNKFKSLLLDNSNAGFGLTTKLAVKPQYRSSPSVYMMLTELYRIMFNDNIQFWFGGCNPYLLPLYERMGFRRFTSNFTDPGYGLLTPIVILVEDQEHFKAVKSPLYRHARKKAHNPEISRRFLQAFPEALEHINTRLITPDALWHHLERRLNCSPVTLPMFRHLTQETVMDLLSSGVIFPCAKGDCILHNGSACTDLYILLAGTLVDESALGSRILHPGDNFGDLIQTDRSPQTSTISALTACELLLIPRQSFERFQHLHPKAAESILDNLKCKQSLTLIHKTSKQGGQNHE